MHPQTSPGGGRAPYATVGAAMRQAIARANGAELSPGLQRTLLAVLHLTASWSKLSDPVYVGEVAQLAGLGDRQTRKSLTRLSALGVIVWVPRRGHGVRSLVGLPLADETGTHGVPLSPGAVTDDKAALQEARFASKKPALSYEETGTLGPTNRHCRSAEDREAEKTLTEEEHSHSCAETADAAPRPDGDDALRELVATLDHADDKTYATLRRHFGHLPADSFASAARAVENQRPLDNDAEYAFGVLDHIATYGSEAA
jgi:hypothetical protein